MRKHALNLFLIILLSLLLFGCSSGEEVGPGTTLISDDGLLTFTISDDGSYLTAENNTTDYSTGEPKTMPADYTIPASYKGIPVKQIGYFRSETLERIVIPEGVTTICGDFSQCPNLKEVVLPDSLEYIGDSAFAYTAIEEIEISEDVSHVGKRAFSGCEELVSLKVPFARTGEFYSDWDSLWNSGISNKDCIVYSGTLDELSFIISADGTYYICAGLPLETTLTEVVVPSVHNGLPVKEIGSMAFSNCNFTSIELPDGLVYIDDWAFNGCMHLDSIVLPDTVKEIGRSVFGVTALKDVVLSDSLEYIGPNAFNGCSNLTDVTLPASVTYIDENAFSSSGLAQIIIPEDSKLYHIGGNAFNGTDLKEISIPSSVVELDRFVSSSNNIERVYVEYVRNAPRTWRYDWASYFADTVEIIHNVEPNKLYLSLDDSQEFYYVDGLSADSTVNFIAIPETYNGLPVTEIGYDAFNGCSSLETVSIPSSISVVQSGAFEGCSNLSDIAFSEDITIISSETFKNCINLTNFTIPSSVTEIGNRAFENSGLVEIDIPENVETMAANVFLDCNNLADIYLHWAEGEKPSGWNMNWNNGVSENVTIHYAGNQGGEDPDDPGTDPDDPSGLEPQSVFNFLDNGLAGLTQQISLAAYTGGTMPEGVSVDVDAIKNNQPYTITMTGAVYEDDTVSIVFYGTYDYELDTSTFTITEQVNLTEGTTVNGEAHTASWKSQGGSSGATTTDIIIDGHPYNP